MSSSAPPSARSVAASLPPLPEDESASPPRKIRKVPEPSTVSDESEGEVDIFEPAESEPVAMKPAAGSEGGSKRTAVSFSVSPELRPFMTAYQMPRPKLKTRVDSDEDVGFFTRRARRSPTPREDHQPDYDDADEEDEEGEEEEESQEAPRGRARRSECTPRPVSHAPKTVVPERPSKSTSKGSVRQSTERGAPPSDSFAVPAEEEFLFQGLKQGRETSTPADAVTKKRSRSRSAAPGILPVLLCSSVR